VGTEGWATDLGSAACSDLGAVGGFTSSSLIASVSISIAVDAIGAGLLGWEIGLSVGVVGWGEFTCTEAIRGWGRSTALAVSIGLTSWGLG
jgi:hypothetical protein